MQRTLLQSKPTDELADNRLGSHWHSLWADHPPVPWLLDETLYLGVKRFRLFINEGDWDKVDWSKNEFVVDPIHDSFVTSLADNDIQITYNLIFWDKATYQGGKDAPCHRFKTEEEIKRYLEFVRFIVDHFRGRVGAYEVWNEPDNNNCPQYIEVQDYINLVRRTVPVIRDTDPDAKIVIGAVALPDPKAQAYLFTVLESDIMPMVDVISWHPFYEHSPEYEPDYYYGYPSLVEQFKKTASAHGFTGEYEADEMNWRPFTETGEPYTYGEIAFAKYWLRGLMLNLGIDVVAGSLRNHAGWEPAYTMVHNLSTVMEGNKPAPLSVTIETDATIIKYYSFSLPDGDKLIGLWNDGAAVNYDPGTRSMLIINDFAEWKATGIDVLNGFEQELISASEGDNLVIHDFLLKDYPIIIRLSK